MTAILFKNYLWSVCKPTKEQLQKLPQSSNVYIISVKLGKKKRRKVIYIGVSGNLRQRILSHSVFKLLRFNQTFYTIEILYKDFGEFVTNNTMERKLIKLCVPPFNGNCDRYRSKGNEYPLGRMWEELGVSKVIYRKKQLTALSEILNTELA